MFSYRLCRFSFTNLDPEDPSRKFAFLLQVDADDKYEIADCQPAVNAAILVEVGNVLNDTDDMSFLVRRMSKSRQFFCLPLSICMQNEFLTKPMLLSFQDEPLSKIFELAVYATNWARSILMAGGNVFLRRNDVLCSSSLLLLSL
jgi:hypothetical protein